MKNIIIYCKTQKDWTDVCKKLEKDYPDVRWYGGEKPTEYEYWSEDSCLYINDNLSYLSKEWYQENRPETPTITAREFLGEATEKEIMPEIEAMKELVDTFVDDWNNLIKK